MQVRVDSFVQFFLAGFTAVEPNDAILPHLQGAGHEHRVRHGETADGRCTREVVVDHKIAKRPVVCDDDLAALGNGRMAWDKGVSDTEHPLAKAHVELEKVEPLYGQYGPKTHESNPAVGNSSPFLTNLPFHDFPKIVNHESWLK